MPHAVFNLGSQVATGDLDGRHLIPGVEPGGSRAGRALKPALLIVDAWVEPNSVNAISTAATSQLTFSLKLSQELDLTPGLLLPIGSFGATRRQTTAVGEMISDLAASYQPLFRAQGTVWAPRVVGIRIAEAGAMIVDADVHLDYERVDVPWMDWLLMWEFLDGIADNEREY